MEELVNRLRQARENKNLSLRDINERTKISMRLLEAIEKGDFSVFEGEVYLTGALRLYAEVVGLNPREVLEEYKRFKEEEQLENRKEKSSSSNRGKTAKNVLPIFYIIAAVAALLALVIGLVIWWGPGEQLVFENDNDEEEIIENGVDRENDTDHEEQNNENEENEENDEAPEPEEPENHDDPEVEVTKVDTSHNSSSWEVEGAEKLKMVLTVNARCWFRVDVDGEARYIEDTYHAGDEVEVEASEEIIMHVGYTSGLNMVVNGYQVEEVSEHPDGYWYYFNLD